MYYYYREGILKHLLQEVIGVLEWLGIEGDDW